MNPKLINTIGPTGVLNCFFSLGRLKRAAKFRPQKQGIIFCFFGTKKYVFQYLEEIQLKSSYIFQLFGIFEFLFSNWCAVFDQIIAFSNRSR